MSEAQKILHLIDTVDPSDTDTLDEIDARVAYYLLKLPYKGFCYETGDDGSPWKRINTNGFKYAWEYTRSRDALKSIRPEGCVVFESKKNGNAWSCAVSFGSGIIQSPNKFKTEELAELHAIIQAIEWERNQ